MAMIAALFPEGVVALVATEEMWRGILHPREEACIARAGEKRRREFTAGRACAREALARFGFEDFALVAGRDRLPLWPRGMVGSISHRAGACGVAVARSDRFAGLGLDVERAGPLTPDLVSRVCRPDEIARLEGVAPPMGSDWPKLIFSAKESTYKCYYPIVRTPLGFHDIALAFSPRAGTFTASLAKEAAPSACGAREFTGRFASDGSRVWTGVSLRAPERDA